MVYSKNCRQQLLDIIYATTKKDTDSSSDLEIIVMGVFWGSLTEGGAEFLQTF